MVHIVTVEAGSTVTRPSSRCEPNETKSVRTRSTSGEEGTETPAHRDRTDRRWCSPSNGGQDTRDHRLQTPACSMSVWVTGPIAPSRYHAAIVGRGRVRQTARSA